MAHPVSVYSRDSGTPKAACGGDFSLCANSMIGEQYDTAVQVSWAFPGRSVGAQAGPLPGQSHVSLDFAFEVPRLRGPDWSFPPKGGTPNSPHQAGGAHAIALGPLRDRLHKRDDEGILDHPMLLAQSGTSQGYGDRVPKSHRGALKPDEPEDSRSFLPKAGLISHFAELQKDDGIEQLI
jgi:hypothetical protein